MEYLIRFIAGGVVVSVFAVFADVLRPKSLAGLLGASPAVALVTLSLAFYHEGAAYASIEGRSMILASVVLSAYSYLVCLLLLKTEVSALLTSTAMMPVWVASALLLNLLIVGT